MVDGCVSKSGVLQTHRAFLDVTDSTQMFKRFYDAQNSVLVVSYLCYETEQ